MIKKFINIVIFFFSIQSTELIAKIENKIVLKVENEIITNFEIKNSYLELIPDFFNKKNEKQTIY